MTSRSILPYFSSLVRPLTVLSFWLIGSLLSSPARAQEGAATATPVTTKTDTPSPSEPDSPKPSSDSSKKTGGRRRTREKEAEGTEARDRFKADTVIKSKYKLDGEPLEVDPD